MPDVLGMYRRYGARVRTPPPSSAWASAHCFSGTHDDRHPSMRVHLDSGGFRCFKCGVHGGALAALELLGVRDPAERVQVAVDYGILERPIKPKPRPSTAAVTRPASVDAGEPRRVDYDNLPAVAAAPARERAWTYVDRDGAPVGRVKRQDLPGGKRIWQERPDGDQWLPGMNGALLPLFRLPQVLERAAARERVLVVEGEKAVDAADKIGLFATTCAGGAGKWRPDHTAALAGANVIAVADSDLAGRLHAVQVTEQLLAADVRARMPLDLAEFRNDGFDLVDYLAGIADTVRATNPEIGIDELRQRLRWNLERQLAQLLPAGRRGLQLFVERARYCADPNNKTVIACDECGQERPHWITHGLAFCPCGAHQVAP